MDYDFDVRVEPLGDGLMRVVARGQIDIAVVDLLTHAVSEALRTDGVLCVEVDCSGIRFLDACGVGALIRSLNEARAHGKTFRIFGTTGLPLRVLELTGVLGLLSGKEVQDSV